MSTDTKENTQPDINEPHRSVSELRRLAIKFEKKHQQQLQKSLTKSPVPEKQQHHKMGQTSLKIKSNNLSATAKSLEIIRFAGRSPQPYHFQKALSPCGRANVPSPLGKRCSEVLNTTPSRPRPASTKLKTSPYVNTANNDNAKHNIPQARTTVSSVQKLYGGKILCVSKSIGITKEEVQATNEGFASVSKISEWLSKDAFNSKKREKVIRKDKLIHQKSLAFEKMSSSSDDQKSTGKKSFIEEIQMAESGVSGRAEWLKNKAFNTHKHVESFCPTLSTPSNVKETSQTFESKLFRKSAVQLGREAVLKREKASQSNLKNMGNTKVTWEKVGDKFKKSTIVMVNHRQSSANKAFQDLP